MMGTLAIMGILAIAGIWMYNSAMDRLKANTIINEAQKRAVVVAGQIGFQDRTDPSLGEFSENEFAGSTFSQSVITHGLYKQFGIQVSGVSQNVCQNILNSIGDSTLLRRLTGVGSPRTALTTCAEDNTFLMIYNNDMSDSVGDTAYTCEKDSDCSACGTCNTETHACENDCPVPEVAGGCDFDNECNANNKCMICNEETHLCEDGCQRVEYLESTGKQWIDTGIVPSSEKLTKIAFSVSATSAVNAAGNGSNANLNMYNLDSTYWRVNGAYSTIPFDLNTFHTIFLQQTADGRYGKIDNSEVMGSKAEDSNNFLLFQLGGATNSMKRWIGQIGYCKIWENGILVRDLIPVHASFQPVRKQNCLFDRVSGDLFCNQGSVGDFVAPATN